MRIPLRAAAVALSALVIPILWIGFDLLTRGSIVRAAGAFLWGTYAAGILLSLLVWGLGMEAARHPRRAVRVVALCFLGFTAAFGIGLQTFVRALTHAYVGRRALMLALGVPDLARAGYFTQNALIIGGLCLVPAAFAVGLAMVRARRFGPRSERPGAAAAGAAAAVLVAVFTPFAAQGFQCLPPDVLWLNGTGGPLLAAVGLLHKPRSLPAGRHEALPPGPAIDPEAPSVVLLLGESVRRDAVCLARAEGCTKSPRLDAAAPDRIGYARAFAVASCTELVSTALWTGMAVTAEPEALSRAPLLWDYAKARGYRTAYLSSQNLLYQQADLFLRGSRIDLFREARDRVPDARVDDGSPDEATTAEAIDFIEKGGPSLVVVHYANTHTPYRQVKGFDARPIEGEGGLRGRYENSLAHNDAVVGDLIERLRKSPRGKRAIVLFASDHGEAFGEHGSFTHSFDLHAEQIDIPLWIDAPPGSLPEGALARLRREAATRPVATFDLAATVLDLLGALDAPALGERAGKLAGTSLLREAPADRAVLLWNCPPTRECASEAFGVVAWPLKLHYVGHETRYACHDLEADPEEKTPLAPERCAGLRALLDGRFGARVDAP